MDGCQGVVVPRCVAEGTKRIRAREPSCPIGAFLACVILACFVVMSALEAGVAHADDVSLVPQVFISEIMYNPVGIDNNHEWVEVYGTDNLSGYAIGDLHRNSSLALVAYVPGDVSVVVEEGFDPSGVAGGINASLYSAGASIGDGLGNTGDEIFLYAHGLLIDHVVYDGTLANGDGKTLERQQDDSWAESADQNGTLGIIAWMGTGNLTGEANATSNQTGDADANSSLDMPFNSSLNGSFNSSLNGSSDGSLNGSCDVSCNVSFNATGNSSENVSLDQGMNDTPMINATCATLLGINVSHEVFSAGPIKYRHVLGNKSGVFSIEYWIEDLQGAVRRERATTQNVDEKSFTPRYDQGTLGLLFRARLAQGGCQDSFAERLVVVNGTPVVAAPVSCPSQSASKSAGSGGSTGGSAASSRPGASPSSVPAKQACTPTAQRKPLRIVSFYTRQKNYAKVITLHASIEGNGSVELILVGDSGVESEQMINLSLADAATQAAFNVTPRSPVQTYVLIVRTQDERDASILSLNLTLPTGSKTLTGQDATLMQAGAQAAGSPDAMASAAFADATGADAGGGKAAAQHAGDGVNAHVVFETTTQKVVGLLPFIASALACVGVWLWWRFRSKGAGENGQHPVRKQMSDAGAGACQEANPSSGMADGEAIDL